MGGEKRLLRLSAAQRAGRPSPTEIFLGVTKLFCGTRLAGKLLEMIGNFTDGNVWSELQLHTMTTYLLNRNVATWATPAACGIV